MELVQSLAGRAGGVMERLTGSRDRRAGPQEDSGPTQNFASALMVAINSSPKSERPKGTEADARAVESSEDAQGEDAADAAAAAAGLAMAVPIDPTRVHRTLDMLDPEFRARLNRVVERMQTEFGHEVRITETYRTQERQNFLYEQGRTRPGQVVTWTRNSNHLLGRAADVMIDGTYVNPKGYARLAQVAAEEGLHTLGPKDPGHIELRGGKRPTPAAFAASIQGMGDGEAWEPALSLAPRASVGGMARVAQVAEVARVADVARVAQVAQVARVAVPGASFGSAGVGVQAAVQALHEAIGSYQGLSSLRSELGGGGGESDASGSNEQSLAGGDPDTVRGDLSVFTRGSFQSAVTEVLGTGGTTAAERAARVMELQDGVASRPLNHVVLRVENPSGGEDRIRVDLRGAAIDATLDMSNSADAERMSTRLGDLQKALESRGLEAETLRVRSTTSQTADILSGARVSLAAAEAEGSRGSRSDSNGSGSSGRDPRDASDGRPRRDPADSEGQGRQHHSHKENS